MNETVGFDPLEYQNIILQSIHESFKAHAPTWLESLVAFVQNHPWVTIGLVLGVALIISAIVREILCQYFKTNEILARLARLEKAIKREE
jgi:hypothetical protein